MSQLTPYLCVEDARAAIDWYVDVLGAEVTSAPIEMPDGRIGHVELAVNGAGAAPRTASPPAGSRCSVTRSGTGGS